MLPDFSDRCEERRFCSLGGFPAGSSGSGTGSSANVYTPKQQGLADKTYVDIVKDIYNEVGSTGTGSPAGWAYPDAQSLYDAWFNPFNPGFAGTTGANTAMAGAYDAADMGQIGAPRLQSAGLDILDAGFDPQSNLYQRNLGRTLDQSNVANAMAGLGSSPYGASVNANALGNFNIDWESDQLDRMAKAAPAGQALLEAAPALESYATELPYKTGGTIGTNALNALNSVVKLGNNQYLLPQQILNDLQSYLKLGQSASTISGDLGQLGFNQVSSGLKGLGSTVSGLGSLFGSGSSDSGGYSTGSNWMSDYAGDYGGGSDYGTPYGANAVTTSSGSSGGTSLLGGVGSLLSGASSIIGSP